MSEQKTQAVCIDCGAAIRPNGDPLCRACHDRRENDPLVVELRAAHRLASRGYHESD